MESDRELVQALRRGEEAAFRRFFDAYFPRLYRFAQARLPGRDADVQEVVQITLCDALDSLASWRGEAAFYTWLCQICRHRIHHLHRRIQPTPMGLADEEPEIRARLDSLAMDAEMDPETLLGRADLKDLVHTALDALPRHYADVLTLKYLRELPVAQIADSLGLSAKATESLLTRARAAFRESLNLHGQLPVNDHA